MLSGLYLQNIFRYDLLHVSRRAWTQKVHLAQAAIAEVIDSDETSIGAVVKYHGIHPEKN